ncbi:MAG: hypothetical protein PHY80_00585 [Rickettsiales bacterium]|nr:hypothetical protein [Rickettsiales bacterium]
MKTIQSNNILELGEVIEARSGVNSTGDDKAPLLENKVDEEILSKEQKTFQEMLASRRRRFLSLCSGCSIL